MGLGGKPPPLPITTQERFGALQPLRVSHRERFGARQPLPATHFVEPGSLPLGTMSTSAKSPSRPVAVLKLPEYEAPLLVTMARAIVTRMTGNAWFPAPQPPLATVQVAIDDLAEAEAATLTKTMGTVARRDGKRVALVSLLQLLQAHVQSTAEANPENGASIIQSAGLEVKKKAGPPPRVFTAKQGPTSGSVILLAPKAGHRAGYEWAYSLDGGTTWIAVPVTVQARTTVTGLKPGSKVSFRYRAVTKDGAGDWSDAVVMIVG